MSESLHLYCVSGAPAVREFGPIGPGGAQVFPVHHRDLTAFVSRSPAPSYGGLKKEALVRYLFLHQAVIEKVMEAHTVVPVKFGTTAPDETEVQKIVERGYPQLTAVLEAMEGKIELDVVAQWRELNSVLQEIGEEEEIRKQKEAIAAAPAEESREERIRIGQRVKARLDQRREGLAAEIVEAIKPLAWDLCPHALLDDRMILNMAQLLLEHEWVVRDFEAQWRTREGSTIWVQINLRAVRNGKGLVRYYEAAALDITERKWAERAVRRSEEHFRSLIENAHDVITVLDAKGIIRYESPSIERVLGYKPEELTGKNAFELVHPDDRLPVMKAFFRGTQSPNVPLSTEFRFRHKDGAWRIFEGVAKNLCEDPIVAGLVINSRDITERKQAEAEVQRQREALSQQEKLAAMGTLLAGVAHELNNPLSVVKGQAALLRGQVGNGRLATRAEKIAQAADRCARIVKNFLALAREHPPERQPVGLNQVVREAVELVAYQLRVDNVEVTFDLAEDLPSLWADLHQLHQLALNLVSNAYQAMRQTAPPRRLTLTTRSDAARARVYLDVADTGPGIPPEIQARIFEPFFTTKPLGQGTGLGLSLCQRIVEAHDGSIRVESQPGQGALFRIELPVEAPLVVESGIQAAEAPPPRDGKAILVVDDEPDVADVLVDLLTADGHQVDTADNGLLALEKLRERTYDLVLSDFRMPELDGSALYWELERSRPDLRPRFMLFTGVTQNPEIREFVEKSRVPTVSKPFDLEEVRRAVRTLLEPMD